MDYVKLVNDALNALEEEGATLTQSNGRTKLKVNPITDSPWNFIKRDPEMNCMLWKTFLYGSILEKLPKEERFVPSHCANCYKVVIRPTTYAALLDLEAIMKELDYPSKCGIETRIFVKGLYGGYFYTWGLRKGLARLNEVALSTNSITGALMSGKFYPTN